MKKNNKDKIQELRDKIKKWNKEYFIENNPSVPDRVYDTNLKLLEKLEKELKINDDFSPTHIIGDLALNKFKKIQHSNQVLSLNKAYSFDEVFKFIDDVDKATEEKNTFFIEPKIDGLSIVLIYEKGKLKQAVTRGDGLVGEDVTDNVYKVIKDVPINIKYDGKVEIRGEIFFSNESFQKLNKKLDNKFANPRNAASGTLRQLDNNIVKDRNLSCLVYEIINNDEIELFSIKKTIDFFKNNNFKYQKISTFTSEKKEIKKFIEDFNDFRNSLNYEVDGLVIKMDNLKNKSKVGLTSKFPKYNIAYKFDDEIVQTKIIDIIGTIGRTGLVTYKAILEPVLLKGTIVGAATLHNANYILDLKINTGDIVNIKKAGEIIPKVVSLYEKKNKQIFKPLIKCPFCHHDLILNKAEIEQFCDNDDCDEKKIRNIIHFASRDALDIKHLGESWVRIFYQEKLIEYPQHIYELINNRETILKLDRISDKSFENLVNSIENSKDKNLSSFIFALGIPSVGKRNAQIISKKLKSFASLLSFDWNKLQNIHDIGPITVHEIIRFLEKEKNKIMIEKLIAFGINPSHQNQKSKNTLYFLKRIAITGTFEITRNQIIDIIESYEAIYSPNISSKTDFILIGKNGGSKIEKAKKLGIRIITLDDLKN